jgi:hypothetical protein
MKSTFFFIAMLLFVNASSDLFTPRSVTDADPVLMEISKDPSSEAVFATMAIQLETQGGFEKVMGLLNELVHDSKEQLHAMTKVWRGVHARCQVSAVKLAGRQEFFKTYLHQAKRSVKQSTERLAEMRDHLVGFAKSQAVYGTLLKQEVSRHAALNAGLKGLYAHANAGLKSLGAAHGAVKDWSPKGRALIQTHLADVAASYMKVKNYELPSINEFLERTTDRKVRKRLLEWMTQVRAQLTMVASGYRNSMARLAKLGGAVEVALAAMTVGLKHGVAHLNKAVTYCQHMVKAGKATTALFTRLAKQNAGLMRANAQYCHAEAVNYNTNRLMAVASVKLFREVRNYFTNHYKKIHSYIKVKYGRTN